MVLRDRYRSLVSGRQGQGNRQTTGLFRASQVATGLFFAGALVLLVCALLTLSEAPTGTLFVHKAGSNGDLCNDFDYPSAAAAAGIPCDAWTAVEVTNVTRLSGIGPGDALSVKINLSVNGTTPRGRTTAVFLTRTWNMFEMTTGASVSLTTFLILSLVAGLLELYHLVVSRLLPRYTDPGKKSNHQQLATASAVVDTLMISCDVALLVVAVVFGAFVGHGFENSVLQTTQECLSGTLQLTMIPSALSVLSVPVVASFNATTATNYGNSLACTAEGANVTERVLTALDMLISLGLELDEDVAAECGSSPPTSICAVSSAEVQFHWQGPQLFLSLALIVAIFALSKAVFDSTWVKPRFRLRVLVQMQASVWTLCCFCCCYYDCYFPCVALFYMPSNRAQANCELNCV